MNRRSLITGSLALAAATTIPSGLTAAMEAHGALEHMAAKAVAMGPEFWSQVRDSVNNLWIGIFRRGPVLNISYLHREWSDRGLILRPGPFTIVAERRHLREEDIAQATEVQRGDVWPTIAAILRCISGGCDGLVGPPVIRGIACDAFNYYPFAKEIEKLGYVARPFPMRRRDYSRAEQLIADFNHGSSAAIPKDSIFALNLAMLAMEQDVRG